MKKLLLSLLFMTSLAQACPILTGQYNCYDQDNSLQKSFQINTYDNVKLKSNEYHITSKLDGTTYIDKYIADAKVRTYKIDQLIEKTKASCHEESFYIRSKVQDSEIDYLLELKKVNKVEFKYIEKDFSDNYQENLTCKRSN